MGIFGKNNETLNNLFLTSGKEYESKMEQRESVKEPLRLTMPFYNFIHIHLLWAVSEPVLPAGLSSPATLGKLIAVQLSRLCPLWILLFHFSDYFPNYPDWMLESINSSSFIQAP